FLSDAANRMLHPISPAEFGPPNASCRRGLSVFHLAQREAWPQSSSHKGPSLGGFAPPPRLSKVRARAGCPERGGPPSRSMFGEQWRRVLRLLLRGTSQVSLLGLPTHQDHRIDHATKRNSLVPVA